MNQKVLATLEYTKIIALLADRTASDMGREQAEGVRPAADLLQAERLMNLTDEAEGIFIRLGRTPIAAFPDMRATLKTVRAAYALSIPELLSAARCLKASREAREAIADAEDCPGLHLMANGLSAHRSIEEEIARCILSDDELADNASSELSRIRRQMRTVNERVRDKLNGFIKNASVQKYLQEPIITMRNGRYTLPVKAEFRTQMSGLIHDQSGSGSTVFIEPAVVVELGNEYKRLQAEEQREVERILASLTALLDPIADELSGSLQTLAALDVIFAKAALARSMRARRPKLTDDGMLTIKKGRHPLLPEETVVPIDVWLGGSFSTLIITGPNTGGKTVTLKTVGLFTLMAMSGMFVPAEAGTSLSVFSEVFADIGDEQSIEQSLSTFSSHMSNIVEILKRANDRSLALLDELGAGTDPVEGAALAQAILDTLFKMGVATLATTHYSEIKAFAITRNGMQNASMEFDVDRLAPTYRLFVGIPGKSNAFEISRRLGLSDAIIEEAGRFLKRSDVAFEDVIRLLEKARSEAERARDEAQQDRAEAERIRITLEKERDKLSAEKSAMRAKAREEARQTVLETRAEMEQLIRELRSIKNIDQKALERAVQGARDAARKSENKLAEKIEQAVSDGSAPSAVLSGQRVRILSLNQEATVLKGENERGEVLVQAGIMKMNVRLSDLRPVESVKKKSATSAKAVLSSDNGSALELDLRGMLVDEGVMEIDRFIDHALLSGIKTFSVIHGKGTGALRTGVQSYLKSDHRVKSYRLGAYGEGDAGVTVVTLK